MCDHDTHLALNCEMLVSLDVGMDHGQGSAYSRNHLALFEAWRHNRSVAGA